jgi:DNA polymerase-3 subunit epsilon
LFEYEARNGYRYLAVGKLAKTKVVLKPFDTIYGINLLQDLAKQFDIDQRFCKYGSLSDGVFATPIDATPMPEVDQHNNQIQAAQIFISLTDPVLLLSIRTK